MRKISDPRVGRQSHSNGRVNGAGADSAIILTALRVAELLPIFPCDPIRKKPLTEHGFKEATQEPRQIRRWWRSTPEALIAVPMGTPSGLVAVDIDPEGSRWFQGHRAELGVYRLHQTRRGKHLLYQYPTEGSIRNSEGALAPGVDVRGEGGYVIWWPAHGGVSIGDPSSLPGWLAKRLLKVTNGHANGNGHAGAEGEVPGEDWLEERSRVVQALAQLDPDCSYETWREIACAISWGSGGSRDGEDVFVAFSRGDYWREKAESFPGEDDVRKKYKSFKNEKDDNITLATLYQLVKDHEGKVPKGRPEEKKKGKLKPLTLKEVTAIKLDSFIDIQHKNVRVKRALLGEWLLPGAWLMTGRPKLGKSWLLLQMMLCLAQERKFLGFDPRFNGYEMLALCAEDDDARIKHRIKALGGLEGKGRTHVINRTTFLELAKQYSERASFVEFLRLWIKAHSKVRLIVVDTEASARLIWGTRAIPNDRIQRITEVDYQQTAEYDQLALETGCSIVLVNHTGKMTGKRNQVYDMHELINRSNMALAGASGSWVLCEMPGTDPNDSSVRQRRMGIRGRDLEADIDVVVSRGQGDPAFISEGDYVSVAQSQNEIEILQELLNQMDGRAEDEYVTTAELAHGLGRPREGVKRAVSRMSEAGRVKWNGYRITIRHAKGLRLDKLAKSRD